VNVADEMKWNRMNRGNSKREREREIMDKLGMD